MTRFISWLFITSILVSLFSVLPASAGTYPARWFQVPGNVKTGAPPYWADNPAIACTVVGTNIAAYGVIKSISIGVWPDQNVSCQMDFYESNGQLATSGGVGIANYQGCLRSTVYDVGLESIRDPDPTTGACWTPGDQYAFKDNGKCSDECNGQTHVGDPINVGNGNNVQEEVDYEGTGPFPLLFKRTYNSVTTQAARLGNQWRHTYDRSLHIAANASMVSVRRPDGRVIYLYQSNGSNEYRGENDIADRLYKNASNWTYTNNQDEIETYDLGGKLISIQNRAGLTMTLTYDSNNQLSTVSDPFGRKLVFTYDPSGRILTLQDADNKLTTYIYDTNNNLSSVTYPDNKVKTYKYEDPTFKTALTRIIDENNNIFATFAYDSAGRAILAEHAGGAIRVTLQFNSDGTTTVTDAFGVQRTYSFRLDKGVSKNIAVNGPPCDGCGIYAKTTYDAYGRIAERTDFNNVTTATYRDWRGLIGDFREGINSPLFRQTSIDLHETFRLPKAIYESGRNTQFQYDAVGNLLQKTINSAGLSRTWKYTYNSAGQILTIDGPRSEVNDITTLTYYSATDAAIGKRAQLATMTNALGQMTKITAYDNHGHPLSITDPNGLVTTLTYDLRGHLTSRRVGTSATAGELTNYTYDNAGQLIKATLPNSAYLTYTYDAAHRLVQIQDQLGNKIVYTLDLMDNRTQETVYDALGNTVQKQSHIYDTLNRLQQSIGGTKPSSDITTYAYDANGNLTNITDPLNRITSHTYDALNRLTQTKNANNSVVQYGYTNLDQITSITDPRNLTTTYNLNGLDDLNTLQSPDSGTTQHLNDFAGNRISKTTANGQTITYQYDALNRVTKEIRPEQTITYTYDAGTNQKGRLTGMNDASGSTVWKYDRWGRVIQKDQTLGTTVRTTKYTFDAKGQLSTMTYPSAQVLSYTWTSGQMTAIKSGTTTILSKITYHPFGPAKSWSFNNGETITRTFDLDGRMTSNSLGTIHYDAAGRIDNAYSRTYGYNTMDQIVSYNDGFTPHTYNWDATGNRTSQSVGSTTNLYTIQSNSNKIQSISAGTTTKTYSHDANGNITTDGTYNFTFDSNNRLIQANLGTTLKGSYTYNGLGQRVRKIAATNVQFVYDEAGKLLGEYNGTTTIQETIYLGDMPVVMTPAIGTFYYIHTDHLGTPRRLTDANKKVRWTWDISTFGATAPNEKPTSTLAAVTYNLAFPGHYRDNETGLHYNYYRDCYDPKTGRYCQVDPIGLAGGINTYAYVNGNPLSYVDPLGLELVPVNLPGLGNTYLDSAFSPKVQQFIDNAAANGVNLHFNSAYRTPAHQSSLRNDPNAITPADRSLHSCGFAIDVNYSSLPFSQQRIIRNAAEAAGLSWGGDFRKKDPPHFYAEPSGSRETAIQDATRDYLRLTGQAH